MKWIKAAEFPRYQDMSKIDAQLHTERVAHRFTMESDAQVLWLPESSDVSTVVSRVNAWVSEPETISTSAKVDATKNLGVRFAINAKPAPVTLALLALSFTGAGLFFFDPDLTFVAPFTFWNPFELFFGRENVFRDILAGQYWRLLTPIFLHFSFMHILFNAMWFWYMGTMIERVSGATRMLSLVFLIGLISNIAQALVSSDMEVFGGLSGVVYGLLTYLWLAKKLGGPVGYQLPNSLFLIMTAFMLISPLGILDQIAGGEVADTAHFAGYFAGLLCALIIYLGRGQSKKTSGGQDNDL